MRKARRVYGRFTAPTLCVAVLLAGAVSAQANDRAADDAFWNTVKSCTNVDEVSLYLEKFPKGRHVAEARACLKKLELSYLSTAERQGDPSKPRQSSPFAVRVLITYCIF